MFLIFLFFISHFSFFIFQLLFFNWTEKYCSERVNTYSVKTGQFHQQQIFVTRLNPGARQFKVKIVCSCVCHTCILHVYTSILHAYTSQASDIFTITTLSHNTISLGNSRNHLSTISFIMLHFIQPKLNELFISIRYFFYHSQG